jgi:hypothetical protein
MGPPFKAGVLPPPVPSPFPLPHFPTPLSPLPSPPLPLYICANGDVCSICSFVTIHFVTYIHTSIHTSVDSITQIHS